MKKFLIVLGILMAIAGILLGVAGYRLNTTYGWVSAKAVGHDTLATPDTRLRVAVDPLMLGKKLEAYLPTEIPLPKWLPVGLPQILPRVLPREVALLGASDFRANAYFFTLFVNEQRGGPVLPSYLNTRTRFKQAIPGITWDEPGFVLPERGVLSTTGRLPLPFGLEETVRETWASDVSGDPQTLQGGHIAEGLIDNRQGEVLVLIAAAAPIWKTSLENLQKNSQFEAIMAMLIHVLDIRFALDFKDADAIVIQFRIHAEDEIGGQLEFFIPLVLPSLAQQVQRQYGLVMTSEYAWRPDEHTYVVDTTISGVEAPLKDYFLRIVPAAPAPAG